MYSQAEIVRAVPQVHVCFLYLHLLRQIVYKRCIACARLTSFPKRHTAAITSIRYCRSNGMQPTISKFFKVQSSVSSSSTAATKAIRGGAHIVDLCDDSRETIVVTSPTAHNANRSAPYPGSPALSSTLGESGVQFAMERKEDRRAIFAANVLDAFDSYTVSKDASSQPVEKVKYTPLEQQVVTVRQEYPDTVLMVECGYRMRFFGDDATIAAKVLSIYARMDHNFMVASVPTYRTYVHCRRLVNAGYKVAVVRQTETAALRKATKSNNKEGGRVLYGSSSGSSSAPASKGGTGNVTFSRAVAGIFSPGTLVDESDPAFQDLLQSSGRKGEDGSDAEEEDPEEEVEPSGQGGDAGDMAFAAGAEPTRVEDGDGDGGLVPEADAWITSVYEESRTGEEEDGNASASAATLVLAAVSVSIRAHRVQCRSFQGASTREDLCDYLDFLKPREVVHAENISSGTQSVLRSLRATSCDGIQRVVPLPATHYLLSCLPDGAGWEWIARESAETQCAIFGLHRYLQQLRVGEALRHAAVERMETASATDFKAEPCAPGDGVVLSSTRACFALDTITARDLEIFRTSASVQQRQSNLSSSFLRQSGRPGRTVAQPAPGVTLFGVINHCRTTFGRRTLQAWLMHPLADVQEILRRQKAVRWLAESSEQSSRYNTNDAATWAFNLQSALSTCADLENLLTALRHGRINPRRVLKLFRCVEALVALSPAHSCYLRSNADLPDLIATSLAEIDFVELARRAQLFLRKLNAESAAQDVIPGVFLPAVELEFYELCALREELRAAEEQMSAELISIRVQLKNPSLEFRSLRTGPVSSIEHLIEVPAGSAARVPTDWIKSNSTKQVDRYHTPAVLALQDRLYQLRDEIKAAARDAWRTYVRDVSEQLHTPLRRAVEALGVLAALLSLSKLCKMPGFVEPLYSTALGEQDEVRISGGRHPMVERYLERNGEQVIPNDVVLRRNFETRSCQVVTGPNMGGKSSYVRMIAVICLLGQIGAHVPAEFAQLCVFDRIFTRMGAGDDLAAGHSTFMSELHRTNFILSRATPRSLLILDELGRGTATNDGLAIAQATLSYCLRRIGSAVLFVTHFPQISELVEKSDSAVTNVEKSDGAVTSVEKLDGAVTNKSVSVDVDAGDFAQLPRGRAVNVHMGFLEDETQKTAENGLTEVMFLYKAVEGPSRGSYGLNVARLAGIPDKVLALAARNSEWMRARRTQPQPDPTPARVTDTEVDMRGTKRKRPDGEI